MTFRCPSLPLLPGYCFNPNVSKLRIDMSKIFTSVLQIGQTRFHRSQYFEHLGDIRMLSDKVRPVAGGKINNRYPSIYARGEVAELPAWIAFDKQVCVVQ